MAEGWNMGMKFLGKHLLVVVGLALLPGVAPAQQPRSIVGDWTTAGQPCTPTAGAIRIGPMAMAADELACSFSSVRREGQTVIWQGVCTGSDDQKQRGSVRATEVNGRLAIVFPNGKREGNLVRCRMP
jgi:hypothetical protein